MTARGAARAIAVVAAAALLIGACVDSHVGRSGPAIDGLSR
ncbi:MAG TPA: hypothetical protein VFI34_09955 [Candidatus Limnocylindrales bacterium]|nr:hypothetical protein [Candidatus Limnocylindrales bacterium]